MAISENGKLTGRGLATAPADLLTELRQNLPALMARLYGSADDEDDNRKPEPPQEVDLSGILGQRVVGDSFALPCDLIPRHGLIAEVMEYNLTTAMYPSESLALAAAIALMSALCSRKVRDVRDTRPNLYVIGLGPTGCGKDHARKVNMRLLAAADALELLGEEVLSSHAGLISSIEAHPARLYQLDEIQWLIQQTGFGARAPHMAAIAEVLKHVYGSANVEHWQPTAYGDRTKNKRINQPHVCLYGTGVPELFFKHLSSEMIDGGFLGRLLVFEETRPAVEMSDSEHREPPAALVERVAMWARFQPGGNLTSEHPVPLVVEMSAEARQLLREHSTAIKRKNQDEEGVQRRVWARAGEQAAKLAMVLAASRAEAPEATRIDVDDARAAIALELHCVRRLVHRATEIVADSVCEGHAKRLLALIPRDRWIPRWELGRKARFLDKRSRDQLLGDLIEQHAVELSTDLAAGGAAYRRAF